MIILHNYMSKASREFVAAYGEGNTVISWYEGGREAWIAAGGTDKVSAFPSIVVDMPAYKVPERLGLDDQTLPEHFIPAEVVMIRKPTSLNDISDWIAAKNMILNRSTAADMPVDPLTIETLDHSDDVIARMKK